VNFVFMSGGLRIGKDAGDAELKHESTLVIRALRELNAANPGRWRRFDPRKRGLTDCRVGLEDTWTGDLYWHERYQIENAAEQFNAGQVFLLKA